MSLSSLLPFTPSLLVHLLRKRQLTSPTPSLPSDAPLPWSCSLPTCVLFIDVSGFTSMTESFAHSGLSGLEQLTTHLNAYFASILLRIQQHRGDLLKVAGDALIVGFYDLHEADVDASSTSPSPSASLPLLCYRAVACALALQAAPSFTAGGVTLGMHIGITCGPTTYIAVGGIEQSWGAQADPEQEEQQPAVARSAASPTSSSLAARRGPRLELQGAPSALSSPPSVLEGGRRWEFLAVGPAFHELSTAVHDSHTGQVVVSEAIHRLLPQVADTQASLVEGDSGNFLLTQCNLRTHSALTADAADGADGARGLASSTSLPLASFLMPALLSRLQDGVSDASQWLGEYRRITVLFVSLPNPEACVLESTKLTSPSSSSTPLSSSSSPPWLLAFHSLFRTLQQCIVRVGGQVRQLLVDDKGCVLIGAFGLPPLAHEDDAVRGVSAALDLLAAARQHHPKAAEHISVGVTTGRAWCGAVGSEGRKEYAMVGNIVNMSARIMGHQLTRQRIMCEEETVKACGGRIRFANHAEVIAVVKGRTGPLSLWEPLGRAVQSSSNSPHNTAPSTPPTLLSPTHSGLSSPLHSASAANADAALPPTIAKPGSRAAIFNTILDQLTGATTTAAEGASAAASARVVVLEGGAGQGKTFLARQVLDAAAARGLVLLMAAGDSVESSTPFFALVPVLQEVVRREWERQQTGGEGSTASEQATASPAQFQATVLSILPAADGPFAFVLLDALQAAAVESDEEARDGAADAAPAVVVEPWLRPKLIRRLMRALLRHQFAAQPSSLLCVEDGHWLDLQSWTLLKELTEEEASVRLLLTTRPLASMGEPSSPVPNPQSIQGMYGVMCRGERSTHFALHGLDEEGVAALACRFLRCASLTEPLLRTIVDKSDGIPLFIQHLMAYMQQAALVSVDPVLKVASLTEQQASLDSSLPSSLETLLASVLDRLKPQCALALKVASVIGRHFACSLLSASHPLHVNTQKLQELMEAAQLQSVVDEQREEDGLGDATYRFTHQLLRDAAYNSLLYHQRRDLHGRIADQLAAAQSNKRSRKMSTASSRASVHLLAHHSWLALCNADDALIDKPEPRLLDAALDYLLQSAADSTAMGILDATSLYLRRAARCIHKVEEEGRREHWQLRWLTSVIGTELITNAPILIPMCKAWGIVEQRAEATTQMAHHCQLHLARRLQQLLDRPCASSMAEQRKQELRFNSLMVLWLASWSGGKAAALESARALDAFVTQAEGSSEAGYYGTEAFFALSNTYFFCNQVDDLHRTFERVGRHAHYRAVLEGKVRFTKYALGILPIARVAMNLARYRWLKGELRSFWVGMKPVMPITLASGHQPSIPAAWLAVLKTVMCAGPEPTSLQYAEKAVSVLPATFSKPVHLGWLARRCMAITLQVWKYRDSHPPASLIAPIVAPEPLPFVDELLSCIRRCTDDGDLLCMQFHFIFQSFPSVLDFRPELPLSVHEAMLALFRRYQERFGANFLLLEMTRSHAALLIRYIQQGQGDAEAHAAEAERLLSSAMADVVYEVTLALKLQMTWTELRVWQGRWEEAEAELQRALDRLPEGMDSESFWVRTAQRMLDEVRRGKGRGAMLQEQKQKTDEEKGGGA